jgi:hypothetical protein
MSTVVQPVSPAARLLSGFLAPLGLPVVFVGGSGFVELGVERVLRVDWYSSANHHEHFDALLLRVVSKESGELDRVVLRFADYFRPVNPRWQGAGYPAKCEVIAYTGWDWYGPKDSRAGHPDDPSKFLEQVRAYYEVWR